MGILDFFTGGAQRGQGRSEPPIEKEMRTYDEIMDEMMAWNIGHTDILNVLRSEVEEKRLTTWSHALETGIRKGLISASGRVEESPHFPAYLDLYQFIRGLRPRLLMNPTMKNLREVGRIDSLSVCIICGIRALQKEMGVKRLLNTLQWKLLERYLG